MRTVLLTLAFIAMLAQPAFAYIDPASGSILLQAIIGGVVAFYVAVKTRVFGLISKFRSKKETPDSPAESTDSDGS